MLGLRGLLYLALGAAGAVFTGVWARHLTASRSADRDGDAGTRVAFPRPAHLAIGAVTNFFDTLGVGSFAPTTSVYKLLRLVPDRLIPGTLLVGHALPILAQAFIYMTIIEVEVATLALLIGASALGSWLGAGVVAGWPRRLIQRGMGLALLGAAAVMLAGLVGLVPAGGDALALSGPKLAAGMAGNFALGALMTIGIGAYAPSLILFGLLGMNVKSIFPIMMGSCAFLMPVGGVRFVRRGSYSPAAALGLTIGGVPAVLVAAYLVRSLPLDVVRWLVLVVVVYTAVAMIRSAGKEDALG